MPNDFDIDAMAAEIGADMGLGGGNTEPVSPSLGAPSDAEAAPAPSPASAQAAAPAPEPAPWAELPKSWKQDYKEPWSTLPDNVRQYIHQREAQATEGVTRYKQQLDEWGNVTKPYEHLFQDGISPQAAFATLARNHVTLEQGTPQEKLELIQHLAQVYNLGELIQFPQAAPTPNPLEGEVRALKQQLAQISSGVQSYQVQKYQQEIEEFAKTAPHFEAAKEAMRTLLQSGAASDLKTAYEQAIWMVPAIRQQLITEQMGNTQKPQVPNTRLNRPATNLSATRKGRTMDETLEETANQLFSS